MRIKGYAGEYLCRSKGIWSSRLLLNPDAFFNIPIVHPPIEDQNAIVAFLEEQTAVINQFLTNKRRLIELLEEQKQVVINTAVMQGLDTAVPRKPSGIDWLGDIPAHWETNRVKFVSKKITDCKNRTPPYFDDGEYFVVRTSNVRNGQLDMTEALFTNEEGFTEWTRRGVPKVGSVLFTREAPAGEACMIPPNLNLCLGQRMMSIEPNEDKLLPRFLLYQLYSDLIKNYITLASAGSTVTHLRVGQVFSLPVLLPPIEEQNRIVEYIDVKMAEINTAIERTQSEIELIEEYRTTLIAHTVTGKIDVRLNNPK